MDSNNVVAFPKANVNIKDEVEFLKEITTNIETMKLYHIQETLSNLIPMIFTQLEVAGFNTDEDVIDIKDGALLIETLRAIMCRHYNITHPFHTISENVFYPDADEVGALRIADSLNIELKKTTESK